MAIRTTLFATILLLGSATMAVAQPSVTPESGYSPQAVPPPPPTATPQLAPATPAQEPSPNENRTRELLQRFGFGFQLFTGNSGSEDVPGANSTSQDGWAVFARFRINPRWEVEVEASKVNIQRSGSAVHIRPTTASGLAHLADISGLDLYLRFGIGRGTETVKFNSAGTSEFGSTLLHVGAGAQYQVWNNISVGLEGRYVRASRSGTELVITGPQYGIVGSYRF